MLTLSNVLKINAISSGATGLILVVLPRSIAPIMGVTVTLPLIMVGAFLVLFALFVFQVGVGKPISSTGTRIVIALDTIWVIASAIALVFLMPVLSLIGNAVVVAVALWVAVMVYLQRRGLHTEFQNQNM